MQQVKLSIRFVCEDAEKRNVNLLVRPDTTLVEVRDWLAKETGTAEAGWIVLSLQGRSLSSSLGQTLRQVYGGHVFGSVLDARVERVAEEKKKQGEKSASPGVAPATQMMTSLQIEESRFAFSSLRGEEANEELRCPICHDAVTDPVEMPCCRKLLCRERCLFRSCGAGGGVCPWCRGHWTAKQLLEPNRTIFNMLATVRVSCDKCKEVVFRGSKGELFQAHLRTCKGKEVAEAPLQVQSGSIQQAIREGELGELLDALDDIRNGLKDCNLKIEFPTVVVCGQESTGKSSVLERICMFPFFPRDHGITTRMPINLRLRHASLESLQKRCVDASRPFLGSDTLVVKISFKDSESRVYSVSASNPEDASKVVSGCQSYVLEKHSSNKSFCHDPLILEAWGESLPDLDLVDLPGVYSAAVHNESSDIVETTRKITEKYLRKPTTLVVAVVPATIDRVRNDVVLGMVQRARKEDLTVCALTKSDKCHRSEYSSTDPFMDLKERARGQADDCPRLGGGFVAVRNRDSRDSENLSLRVSAERERSWFLKFMPDLVRDGCATADCLVRKIGDLMTRYTTRTWSVNALSQIEEHERKASADLLALGKDPTSDPEGVLMDLLSGVAKRFGQMSFGRELETCVDQLIASHLKDAGFDTFVGGGFAGARDTVTGKNARSDPVAASRFKRVCETLRTSIPSAFVEKFPEFLAVVAVGNRSAVEESFQGFVAFDQRVSTTDPKRFDNFSRALSCSFVTRLQKFSGRCKERWSAEFPLLVVAVTISDSSLSEAVKRLVCAIVMQEFDLSPPSRKELLQVMSLEELLQENCAEQRSALKRALKSIDRAKIQVQKLQNRK